MQGPLVEGRGVDGEVSPRSGQPQGADRKLEPGTPVERVPEATAHASPSRDALAAADLTTVVGDGDDADEGKSPVEHPEQPRIGVAASGGDPQAGLGSAVLDIELADVASHRHDGPVYGPERRAMAV